MDHHEIQELLPAYVDQELGVADALAMEGHLASCAECQRDLEEQRTASAQLRQGAPYFTAPAATRARLMAALPKRAVEPVAPAFWRFRWPSAAAALAVVVAVMWGGWAYLAFPSAHERLTEELIASHIRSLQVDHLSDVASSDQHTVKPWFIGKLNFAPPVVDLASRGFPLVGGRLDYLHGREVAVLVYRRNRHPINLYVWPGFENAAVPGKTTFHGYHLVQWTSGGMNYSAVSDVAPAELTQFAQMVRAQAAE